MGGVGISANPSYAPKNGAWDAPYKARLTAPGFFITLNHQIIEFA